MTTRLDISVGPVQGFVSQSRRTRDLWGSSYLLAFLSAHAMHGAKNAGARIVQPAIGDDPLYGWVAGRRTGDPPRFGTLPNHFVVEVDSDDARRVAVAADESIAAAWKRVHDAVWGCLVAHACPAGNGTEAIWTRQVGAFWEVMWTAAPTGDQGRSFARRKHWRSHIGPDEPGDKCTVMHDLQELSGYVRAQDRRAQDQFWERVRDRIGPLDLRDNERLCAIALVKRLLPKPEVARQVLGWDVDAARWPSTVHVGAVPWMQRVVSTVPRAAAEYADVAIRYGPAGVRSTQRPPFDLGVPGAGDFPRLDANYLHREFVTSERLCPLNESAAAGSRKELADRLNVIYDTNDEDGRRLGPPPAFYALLLADGDRLGRLLGELGGETVSDALRKFTARVPKVVEEHDGVTIYAGGDDVLAMLPVPSALDCAQALSDAYRSAFVATDGKDEATLSAAVVFAHVRLPLNHVLGESHRLLDTVAKDGNGRDSVVAAVLKPGGPYCQWVTTWIRPGPDGAVRATDQLHALKHLLDANTVEPGLSSALVYRVRETLTRLCGWEQWRPGEWGSLPDDVDIRAFLGAEIRHSLDVRTDGATDPRADILTESVWNLLGSARNPQPDSDITAKDGADGPIVQAGVDALLLARFFADPGQEESDR